MEYYIRSTKICFEEGLFPATLHVKDGYFYDVLEYDYDVESLDYGDTLCIPGLFDTHTHGYGGYSFTSTSTSDDIVVLLKLYASLGVTSLFASSSISGYPSIVEASKRKTSSKILGIHAEGPFLSDKRFGIATPGTSFIKPSIDIVNELIDNSKGLLKVMSIAPENKGAHEVIEYLKDKGIKVSVGHSDAKYNEFQEMISYYDVITHLGNAMSGIHHRDVGVLGASLLSNLPCELIGDGMHICKEMMEIMFKLKPLDQFILISDSIPLSGVPFGTYELDYTKVFVKENGFIINEFGHITGSSQSVLFGIKTIYELFNFPLNKIVNMASLIPSKLYGYDKEIGSISKGKKANFVLVDSKFNVVKTYLEGECVYDSLIDKVNSNPNLLSIIKDKSFMNFYK